MPPWEKYKRVQKVASAAVIPSSVPGDVVTMDIPAPPPPPSGKPWEKYAKTAPSVETNSVEEAKQGLLGRADIAAGNLVKTGLDVVAAPFEALGEAIRLPMEGKPASDFRAPTIVQRFRDNSLTAENPPADPFTQINKGIRGAAGFVENIPKGLEAAKAGAKAAYGADRGVLGQVEDVALALATGRVNPKIANAPAEALVEGARQVMRSGKKLASGITKGIISTTLGPSIKDINLRISRNPEIVNAKPFDVLARELPDDVQRLSDNVSELSGKALDTLSPSKYLMEGAKAKDSVLNAVRREKEGMGRSVSDATFQAKKVLDRYAARMKRLGNTVSEKELGQIIRDIDNDIDWSSKEMTPLNNALEGVRTKIDGILKGENKAYADAMVPVAEGTRLLKKAQSIFQVESDIGKGFKAKNSTAAALKGAIKETRVDSQDVLEALKRITGRDYLREAENAAVAEAFTGGRASGSRRVNLGTLIGAGAGAGLGGLLDVGGAGTMGALLGGATGAYLDTQGGKIAGSLVDELVRLSKSMTPGRRPSPALRRVLDASGLITAAQ